MYSSSKWKHPQVTSTARGRWSLVTKKRKVGILSSWQYFQYNWGCLRVCPDGGVWPWSVRVTFPGLSTPNAPLKRACVSAAPSERTEAGLGLSRSLLPLGQSGQGLVKLNGRFQDNFFLLALNTRYFKNVCRLSISVGKSVNVTSTLCTLVPPGVC